MRSGTSRAASAVLCAAVLGCGGAGEESGAGNGAGEEPADGVELDERSQDLRCNPGGIPSNDPDCPWRNWARLMPRNNTDITHTRAPALCAGAGGWMTVSVDPENRYRVLQWHAQGRGPEWSVYGASRTWNSKPACAMREDVTRRDGVVVDGMVIAGKLRSSDGNNNKLHASPGILAAGAFTPDNPTFERGFELVDNNVYNVGGIPGMASVVDENGAGVMVLAVMGDDGRTIYAHSHKLPYISSFPNPWTARVTGPVLPTGWTAVGAPTIVRYPMTFNIVVHAVSGTSHRLYETFLYASDTVTHFSNEIGSPARSWRQIPITGRIDDDPALTMSSSFGRTIYFRRDKEIVQTTDPLGSNPLLAIRPVNKVEFEGAPAATADVAFDMGRHVVNARAKSGQIFWIESNSDGTLTP